MKYLLSFLILAVTFSAHAIFAGGAHPSGVHVSPHVSSPHVTESVHTTAAHETIITGGVHVTPMYVSPPRPIRVLVYPHNFATFYRPIVWIPSHPYNEDCDGDRNLVEVKWGCE